MNRTDTAALLADLRSAYADVRRNPGLPVDRSSIECAVAALPAGAERANVAAAFEALLGLSAGAIEASIVRTADGFRRIEERVHAGFRAEAKRVAKAKAADARREAARLARETAATVTEW